MIHTNISPSPHPGLRRITLRIRLSNVFSALPEIRNHRSKELGVASAQPSLSQVESKGHQGHLCGGNELLQTKLHSHSLPKGKNLNPSHSNKQRKPVLQPHMHPLEPFWSYIQMKGHLHPHQMWGEENKKERTQICLSQPQCPISTVRNEHQGYLPTSSRATESFTPQRSLMH